MPDSWKAIREFDMEAVHLEKYLLREVAGRFFVLDVSRDDSAYTKPLEINEMGAVIFGLLKQGSGREEIIDYLCAEYSIDKNTVSSDVEFFIEQLINFGIPSGEITGEF